MPATIPLQDSVVYGPVQSRRLGASLGINLLPLTRKVCSSNCVYCQYGWTEPADASGEGLRRAPELLEEIAAAFQAHAAAGTRVDHITLAGNGEPTLHPDLPELVEGLRRLRDVSFPAARLGILTDATQVRRPRVREALARLDDRYLKFDAADPATWQRINLPLVRLSFDDFVDALKAVPGSILQSMFIQGTYDNTGEAHVAAWIRAVGEIRPLAVQVYTVDRGTAAEGITEVPRAELETIATRLTWMTGVPAEVFD